MIIVFIAWSILLFGQTVTHAFVDWDDPLLIINNQSIHAINAATLWSIVTTYDPELYIPLTLFSFQITHATFGLSPVAFHLIDVALHTINALLVVWFIALLTRTHWIGIVTGVLFLIHPIQVEAVAWASARKDTLSTLFFLITIIAYLQYRRAHDQRMFAVSILCHLFSLLAKVNAITMPLVLLLIDWIQKRPNDRSTWAEKIPFFLLAILFGTIGMLGKTNIVDNTTTIEKLLMAAKSTVFYIQQIVWPSTLSVHYPYTESITLASPDFFIPVGLVLLIACTMWQARMHRFLVGSILFFFITLAPTFLNFAKGGNVYLGSDRYVYIPVIGLFLIAAIGAHALWQQSQRTKGMVVITTCSLCLLLSILTWHQVQTWRNTETLFQQVLAYDANWYLAHEYLGRYYTNTDQFVKAEQSFAQALAGNPPDSARIHSNIGTLYGLMGRLDQEKDQYESALHLDASFLAARYNLALVERDLGNTQKAIDHLKKLLAVDPDFYDAAEQLRLLLDSR